MKERPILFSAQMVQAILSGRKTQTRRVMKPQPWQLPAAYDRIAGWMWTRQGCGDGDGVEWGALAPMDEVAVALSKYCPYGKSDDRLWVRESFKFGRAPNDLPGQGIALFGNDARTAIPHPDMDRKRLDWCRFYKSVPAIHMPRWASRLTLEVTGVRVERVQEISEEDARAEGCTGEYFDTALNDFVWLWNEINDKREGCSWDNNPWVWVIEFREI